MAIEFRLPDVGEGLHEAELLKWLVKEGDEVAEDQPLMEVQTDKAAVEITSPVKAKIAKLIGHVGEILKIGSVVIVFDDGLGGAAPQTPAPEVPAEVRRALAAPATRKLARQLGVDINQVPGTGPAGRVTPDDLRHFAEGEALAAAQGQGAADPQVAQPQSATAAPAYVPSGADERLPLRGIRKVIAERMVRSKQTAPHVTCVDEVDMTELIAFRDRAKEIAAQKGIKLSYMPFIFKALTVALKEYPYLNGLIDDANQEIVLRKQYHLGFALDTEAGLLVPVIKDADKKSVFQTAAEMQDLIKRGREGKLLHDELKGSTFTVSNQGSIGGLFFTPVINHPEVAILGVGKTQGRPVVRSGEIVIRQMAYLALSFDHRLIDGGMATRFLTRVTELLTNPTLLMMEAM